MTTGGNLINVLPKLLRHALPRIGVTLIAQDGKTGSVLSLASVSNADCYVVATGFASPSIPVFSDELGAGISTISILTVLVEIHARIRGSRLASIALPSSHDLASGWALHFRHARSASRTGIKCIGVSLDDIPTAI